MVSNLENFKEYLKSHTQLSERVISNTICRVRRADKILPYDFKSFYLERLGRVENFKKISYTVQSQLRGAMRKYESFLLDTGTNEIND